MSDSQPAQEQNAEPSNNYKQDLTEKKEASKQKTLKHTFLWEVLHSSFPLY